MVTDIKFGGTKKEQDELSHLVLIGKKTATSSLYELNCDNTTRKGDIWKIMDGSNNIVCSVKVIAVEMVRFNQIADDFALKEGDGSFENWFNIHSNYYNDLLEKRGKELKPTTLLECVYFERLNTHD